MFVYFWNDFPLCFHGILCIWGLRWLPALGGSFGISVVLEKPPLLAVGCTMQREQLPQPCCSPAAAWAMPTPWKAQETRMQRVQRNEPTLTQKGGPFSQGTEHFLYTNTRTLCSGGSHCATNLAKPTGPWLGGWDGKGLWVETITELWLCSSRKNLLRSLSPTIPRNCQGHH